MSLKTDVSAKVSTTFHFLVTTLFKQKIRSGTKRKRGLKFDGNKIVTIVIFFWANKYAHHVFEKMYK